MHVIYMYNLVVVTLPIPPPPIPPPPIPLSPYPPGSPHPGTSPLPRDPLAVSVVTQCETLKALVMEWEEKVKAGGGGMGRGEGGEGVDPQDVRRWILPETREFLADWLAGASEVSMR